MKQVLFTGVCTALVTPFLDNKVNYPLMEQLLKRQLDAGVGAVVLSGTTGESPTLSDSEKIELFRRAKSYVGSACKIIAGTGTNATEHAIELSQAAEEAGADGVLLVAPYYNKGNTDSLYAHFASIAYSIRIPAILYNVPSRTGLDLSVELYKRLSSISNIIGVKEAAADITKIAKIRNSCPTDFYIWTGNDDLIVPAISLGAQGVVSVISNICPEETVAMTEAALGGDFHTAATMQCRLFPLIELLFSEVNPIPVKYAMRCVGFDCGDCRLPLGLPSEKIRQKLNDFLA